MKRGEVWWCNLAPPKNRRPVLLLSRDEVYRIRTQATIAVVTTRIRGIPVEVQLGADDGLPKECVANLDTIMTIPISQLDQRIALLSTEKMVAVEAAIRFALGMNI